MFGHSNVSPDSPGDRKSVMFTNRFRLAGKGKSHIGE
jgi:hypothetical protein